MYAPNPLTMPVVRGFFGVTSRLFIVAIV